MSEISKNVENQNVSPDLKELMKSVGVVQSSDSDANKVEEPEVEQQSSVVNNEEQQEVVQQQQPYEYVNHPTHYNQYSLEVIYILERIYGTEAAAQWCEMTAMKYRLRMGTKKGEPVERDLNKEAWYLNKRDELLSKLHSGEFVVEDERVADLD